MSKIYTDLNTVLTPYATAIKKNASDITSLNGSLESLDNVLGWKNVGTADASNEFIYPYHSAQAVRITTQAEADISIHGITVNDFDTIVNPQYEHVEEIESEVGHTYRITDLTAGDSINDYKITGKFNNFTVGKQYRICLKITDPQNDMSGGGHYGAVKVGSITVTSMGRPTTEERIYTATFTAKNTRLDVSIFPFRGTNGLHNYEHAVGDTFRIDDFYVNEVSEGEGVDLFTHEAVFSVVETTDIVRYAVNGGMFVASSTENMDVFVSGKKSKLMTINNIEPGDSGNLIIKSHLQEKKAVVFGDSVMGKGVTNYHDCPYFVRKITGMDVINLAMGGSAIHVRNDTEWDAMGFVGLCEQIVSDDYSRLQAASNYNFEGQSGATRVYSIISNIDWSTVDFVIINYAGNDIGTSDATYIIDDTTNPYNTLTYLGAFRTAIETLLREYPHLQVLVTTGVWRWWKINNEIITSEERVMANNHYYYEWGDALMECAQNEYHFPVFDFYRNLGANKLNYLEYSTDGSHPEEEYLERMGSMLAAAMMSKF